MRKLVILLALGLAGAWWWQAHRPVDPGPGAVAPQAPRQGALRDATPIETKGFRLQPLAQFELTARVLGREDYRFDTESALSPTDLALGWGRMSDAAVLGKLRISQSGRWYSYGWDDQPPIPTDEIARSSANMHLIPADAAVAGVLSRVREGQVVALRGVLVEAQRDDGWRWRSSLSRDDTGGGACELIWVESLSVRP
jgi:hypothetical protein